MWAKWSGTHQDNATWWRKTASGSALDANGNTLSDPSGKSYSWDFENRMVSVAVPGTGTVSFKYDPFGRRIYKSSPTFTGIFVYDRDNLIETANASGTEVASYTHTRNIDEPLAELRSGGASYYEADGLGSITSLSTSAGTIANTYTYDSLGNLANFTGTLRNPFQYTGREFDPETGLYYYRARYFDQNVGRFNSEDPIRFKGGNNFYEYAYNNPVKVTDPRGLQAPGPAPVPIIGPGPIILLYIDGMLAQYDWNQFQKLCAASGWAWCTPPQPQDKSCKNNKDCTDRRNREMDFCNAEYSNYPSLLSKCRERANERWNACLRGMPDPGPLDPLDPSWSPD